MSYTANLISNGTYESSVEWPGGRGKFVASSSAWTGGEIKLQYLDMNGSWVDVDCTNLTSNTMSEFVLPQGRIKAVQVTGGAVALYSYVHRFVL